MIEDRLSIFKRRKLYNLQKNGKAIKKKNNEEDTMEESKLKNMIVLKNLPSNLIEEAIVILKSNRKVKKLEKIDKEKRSEEEIRNTNKNKREFVVKEAEMIISSYIKKIEENKQEKQRNRAEQNKKLHKLRNYAYISSIIILLQALLLIAK